ncbi:MAG: ATP-binding protein [Sphingomicrobium sp.]
MTLIVIHGVESTGKTTLGRRLAGTFGAPFLPEYGRAFCEIRGTDCSEEDLLVIGRAQQANIETALAERPIVISDTDSLTTAAWAQMTLGKVPPALFAARKADLYLHCAPDTLFVEDGIRMFGDPTERLRFDAIARSILHQASVSMVEVSGSWDERYRTAAAAIERLLRRAHQS